MARQLHLSRSTKGCSDCFFFFHLNDAGDSGACIFCSPKAYKTAPQRRCLSDKHPSCSLHQRNSIQAYLLSSMHVQTNTYTQSYHNVFHICKTLSNTLPIYAQMNSKFNVECDNPFMQVCKSLGANCELCVRTTSNASLCAKSGLLCQNPRNCGVFLRGQLPNFVAVILWNRMDNRQAGEKTIAVTSRELEILRLLAKGYSSTKIAGEMGLRPETIVWYRKGLHIKFDVHSTAELLVKAIEKDIL